MWNVNRTICESELLIAIEQLVLEIQQKGIISSSNIDQLPYLVSDFLLYRSRFKYHQLHYSGTINIFIQALESIGYFDYTQPFLSDKTDVFIQAVAQNLHQINADEKRFQNQESRNRNKLVGYVSNLINHYSQLLFVRVDLSYYQTCRMPIGIVEFAQHKEIFLRLISNQDTCFKDLQGYAWALEQGGKSGGYHCHLLLIYDGKKHQNDWYLAQEVGKRWQQITQGQGTFFNCNTTEYKNRLADNGVLGIGMIHRNNEIEVNNAICASNYLVNPEKGNQHLRVTLPRMRTFGTGQFNVSWRRGINRM